MSFRHVEAETEIRHRRSSVQNAYQSPPVNWGINTERKRAFFRLVSELAETNAR